MEEKLGKLFVFEGPDGVGKTSLSEALAVYLRDNGVDCLYLSFPGREVGTLGSLVYQLHHDKLDLKTNDVNPASLQILHIAAHVDIIERQILPALRAGRTVILDRFWWSTKVYGSVSDVSDTSIEAMLRLEAAHWNGINPTQAFVITRSKPLREDEAFDERWQNLNSAYLNLVSQQSDLHPVEIIHNESSVQDALDEIVGLLKND